MKIFTNKIISALGLTLFSLAFFAIPVNAQCVSSWIPDILQTYICNGNPEQFIEYRIRALFAIAVGVIILVAIAMGLRMSLKLITSGGQDAKKQEAFDGIKAIFLGIASIFVILLAIPLVLGYFGFKFEDMSTGILICTRAPQGAGCYACMNKSLKSATTDNAQICAVCDSNSNATIAYPATSNGSNRGGQVNCTTTMSN
jgi:hypothetical protein